VVYFTSTQKLTSDAVDGTGSGNAAEGRGCAGTPENQVSPEGCNLYVYDFGLAGAECQEMHKCLRLVAGGEVLGVAGIAENGQRIYYVKRALGGVPDLYVYDLGSGQSKLVTALSYTGGEEEEAIWQRLFRHPVEVSGENGRDLLFVSFTPGLTPDDKTSTPQLFEYDAVSGELVRVSKGEDGYNENGNAATAGVGPESIEGIAEILGRRSDFKSSMNHLNMSFDGKTVVFKSSGRLSRLASSAERGCSSIYEFRTEGALSEGSVHLLSDGVDVQVRGSVCGAGFEGIDGTGDNILFSTADPLLSSDVDGVQRDVYDARVNGGFASASSSGSCVGDCGSPSSSSALGLPTPSSATQGAEGGVSSLAPRTSKTTKKKARSKCAKGKTLKHRKCVKAEHKAKARKASNDRRGQS
jgi:hypothetical protein